MALPPIILNSPLLKFFRADKSGKQAGAKSQPQASSALPQPQDVVKISSAAQAKLPGVGTVTNDAQAQSAAAKTRALLGQTNLSLGLDPSFS
jgi:hypothetical protein